MAGAYDFDKESLELRPVTDGTAFIWRGGGADDDEVEMARWDTAARLLTITPLISSLGSLTPQFHRIVRLEFSGDVLTRSDPEDFAEENEQGHGQELACLPRGFGRMFRYGLGLRRQYRGVIGRVEEHTDCTAVRISVDGPEGAHNDVFHIQLKRFEDFRSSVDGNRARATMVAARVNATEAHNAVADLLGLEVRLASVGRHPVIVAMTRELTNRPVLDVEERRQLVQQASAESRVAAAESPEEFGRLRKDIELVSLDVLIEHFDAHMTGASSKSESVWQKFFEANTFSLQQLFAAPIALYGGQLTVRGVNARGRGSRIADFVLVNTVLRTALVVEIKTPAAGLVGSLYRGTDGAEVHLPHKDLQGAIAQVQSQMESVRVDLPQLLLSTPGAESLETFHVRGAVIVGTAGGLEDEQKAAYLRHRAGMRDIEILAFDEVRDRLVVLRDLLADPPSPSDASA